MSVEVQTFTKDRLLDSLRSPAPTQSSAVMIQPLGKKKVVVKIPNKTLEIITNIFSVHKIRREDFDALVDGFTQDGEKNYYLKRECDTADVEYFIPESIVDDNMPSLTGMERTFYCALIMAFGQGKDVITIKPTRVLELMGYSNEDIKARSGLLYKNLKLDFRALAGMLIHYESKGYNGEKILIGTPISYRKDSEGITIAINKLMTQGMDFRTKKVIAPYTELPKKLLADKAVSLQERSLRIKLQTFIGIKKLMTWFGSTILKWAQVRTDTLKKRDRRLRAFDDAMKVIEDMGFKLVKIDKSRSEKDCRKWKLSYRAPSKKRGKQGKFTDMDSPEVVEFIDKFIEWQGRAVHYGQGKAQNTPKRIRELISNTIKGNGFEVVKKVFDEVQRTSDPSPRHFWKGMSEAKKKKVAACG